jgi:hypothetical protein
MAHTFDTKAQITLATTNPQAMNYTCGASATLLIVGLIYANGVRTGNVTYNGVALTQADQTRYGSSGPEARCELWYMIDPPVGSAYEVSIPNPNSLNLEAHISSYCSEVGCKTVFHAASGNVTSYTLGGSVATTEICLTVAVGAGGFDTFVPTSISGTILYGSDNGTWGGGSQYKINTTSGNMSLYWYGLPGYYEDNGSVIVAFANPPSGIRVSKANIYDQLKPPEGISISKANIYDQLKPPIGISVSETILYSHLTSSIRRKLSTLGECPDLTNNCSFTISFWLYISRLASGNSTGYLSCGDSVNVTFGLENGVDVGFVSVTTPNRTITSTESITQDECHFIAIYFNGTVLSVKIDDVLIDTDSGVSGIVSADGSVEIWSTWTDEEVMSYSIDEVGIWTQCLTAAQLTQLYTITIPSFPIAWGYWKMEETSGDRFDSSGHARILEDYYWETEHVGIATGKLGNAAKFFTDDNCALNLEDGPDFSNDTQWTVTFWFNGTDLVADSSTPVEIECGFDYLDIGYYSNGGNNFNFSLLAGNRSIDVNITLTVGDWHFVAIYYDGIGIYLEVDNVLIASDIGRTGISDYYSMVVTGYEPGNGYVDELGVWLIALTAEQRSQLWNNGNGWSPY